MSPKVACLTNTGAVREHNEDAFAAHPELGLWIVADGMGGVSGGEVASAVAVETIARAVEKGATLSAAMRDAHRAIVTAASLGQGSHGMGTTAVAVRLDGRHFALAWVGDSRAYLLRHGQSIQQLTHDHSYVQALLDQGLIDSEQADAHPYRHLVTRALGSLETAEIEADQVDGELRPGDWLLLCTDGLTGELSDAEIGALIEDADAPEAAAQALVAAALERGGHDNITVILLRC